MRDRCCEMSALRDPFKIESEPAERRGDCHCRARGLTAALARLKKGLHERAIERQIRLFNNEISASCRCDARGVSGQIICVTPMFSGAERGVDEMIFAILLSNRG